MNGFTIPKERSFEEANAARDERYNRRVALIKAFTLGVTSMAIAYTLVSSGILAPKKRELDYQDKSVFAESPVKPDLSDMDLSRGIGHISLDLEHKFLGGVTDAHHAVLDEIVETCREELKDIPLPKKPSSPNEIPEENLFDIHTILRAWFSFSQGPSTTLTNSLGINEYYERHFDATSASLIYLTIGEKLKFPLSIARVPGHTFLRWRLEEKKHMNWEPVYSDSNPRKGLETDEDYTKRFKIPEESIRQGVFLRSLSKREALSLTLENVGYFLSESQRYRDTLMALDLSLGLDPKSPYSHVLRGFALDILGRKDEALESYEQSLKLFPGNREVRDKRDQLLNV
jgi:tetratricopeptide (TPR) repeat protein